MVLLSCATSTELLTKEPVSDSAPGFTNGIVILTWNIGYAGLGENAEFIADGGHKIIPSSRSDVQRNIRGITAAIEELHPDILLLQEAALPSNVNRFADLFAEVSAAMPGYWAYYSPKFILNFLFITNSVGQAVFLKCRPDRVLRIDLSAEKPGRSLVRQRHHLLLARYRLSRKNRELVVINVHLSAFDKKAALRRRQLSFVSDLIEKEYLLGNYVVCGGDWNFRLAETRFVHTTKDKYLFWVFDLPEWFPPEGWMLAVDPGVPSVRTLERPFHADENYTTVIDGFVLSPNVELIEVHGLYKGFKFSDHNPVMIKVALH